MCIRDRYVYFVGLNEHTVAPSLVRKCKRKKQKICNRYIKTVHEQKMIQIRTVTLFNVFKTTENMNILAN